MRDEVALDMSVSPEQLPRACRIMDAILKALEQYGAKVGIERENEYKTKTYVQLDGEKVRFELDELMRMVKTEPDKYGYNHQDYVPRGKLVLRIKEYVGGCQSKWTEGERSRLEDKLASFINGLSLAAAHIKKSNKEREEEHRRWEEERKAAERKRLAHEEEQKRGQILERQATSWQKSQVIHDFIQAAIAARGEYAPDSEFGKWVVWAKAHADRLDPLNASGQGAQEV